MTHKAIKLPFLNEIMPPQKGKYWKNKNIVAKLVQRNLILFIQKLCNADKTNGVEIVTVTEEID